jgi:acyl-CoA synthetase (NDP forming)
MKTQVYVLAADQHRSAFRSRLLLAALILALLASFLPAANVFAAPSLRREITEDNNLGEEWSNKVDQMWEHNRFYATVRLNSQDFKNKSDLALAQYYLDKYKAAWKQANAIVVNHAGFDLNGEVTDLKLADQSVHDLAMYLHMLRGLREKLGEVTP